MSAAPRNPWRPQYGFRRFDRWFDLRRNQRDMPPLRFGPYLTRSGLKRVAEHYGITFETIDQRSPKAIRLANPQAVSNDRLRRLANYIDRTPKLRGLKRLSMAIRRQLVMPDRNRHKSF